MFIIYVGFAGLWLYVYEAAYDSSADTTSTFAVSHDHLLKMGKSAFDFDNGNNSDRRVLASFDYFGSIDSTECGGLAWNSRTIMYCFFVWFVTTFLFAFFLLCSECCPQHHEKNDMVSTSFLDNSKIHCWNFNTIVFIGTEILSIAAVIDSGSNCSTTA